ncbi:MULTISPECIES: helix-turn-helix domain-containing protein [unclassified Frankia]|uniref:helix-turn-helix domain-containing protein n=1 Tax=unclassified Frankia TaxID=2632575 RepID=UPI001EE3B55F|nr:MULTISPECIES: AraC family transcriptional regulator [unclassified Frankia]
MRPLEGQNGDQASGPARAWLTNQRLNQAEELLETTDLPVEHIAHHVGYTSSAALRDQFVQRRGVPPREYRRTFLGRQP